MNKAASHIKPLMPILSAAYGVAVIFVTAMPVAGDNPTVVGEVLTWLITLAGIALTLFLVLRVEPKVFPTARQFPLKLPKVSVIVGLLLLAPLWRVADEYIVYGITTCTGRVVLQANGYLTLQQPPHTGSRRCGDGDIVWGAPRA